LAGVIGNKRLRDITNQDLDTYVTARLTILAKNGKALSASLSFAKPQVSSLPLMALTSGMRFGPYEIESLLRMGKVYAAALVVGTATCSSVPATRAPHSVGCDPDARAV
jgi:hypothetical protein